MSDTRIRILTVDEVGVILKINSDTVRRLIKRKNNPLPAVNIGSGERKPQYRIFEDKLDGWMESEWNKPKEYEDETDSDQTTITNDLTNITNKNE